MAQEQKSLYETVRDIAIIFLVLGGILAFCSAVGDPGCGRKQKAERRDMPPTPPPPVTRVAPPPVTRGTPPPVIAPPVCRDRAAKVDRDELHRIGMLTDGTIVRKNPRTARLPDEDVRKFQEVLREYGYLLSLMQSQVRPIDHVVLRKRLEEARDMILTADAPPCAWRWERVRELVKKYGGHLVVDGYGRINPFNEGNAGRDHAPSFVVISSVDSAESMLGLSSFQLSFRMIKTATRILLEELLMEESGFGTIEMYLASMVCQEYETLYFFLGRSLADWNVLRYAEESHDMKLPTYVGRHDLEDLHAFDRSERISFLTTHVTGAVALVKHLEEESGATEHFSNGWSCNLPPIMRGPNKGMEFYPFDINDPLINLFEHELLEVGSGVRADPQGDAGAGSSGGKEAVLW